MATEGSDRQPKYQRIAETLRQAIQAGEYGPGARLPGENDLMATYGVARMTARQALGVLQNEGRRRGNRRVPQRCRCVRPVVPPAEASRHRAVVP